MKIIEKQTVVHTLVNYIKSGTYYVPAYGGIERTRRPFDANTRQVELLWDNPEFNRPPRLFGLLGLKRRAILCQLVIVSDTELKIRYGRTEFRKRILELTEGLKSLGFTEVTMELTGAAPTLESFDSDMDMAF